MRSSVDIPPSLWGEIGELVSLCMGRPMSRSPGADRADRSCMSSPDGFYLPPRTWEKRANRIGQLHFRICVPAPGRTKNLFAFPVFVNTP